MAATLANIAKHVVSLSGLSKHSASLSNIAKGHSQVVGDLTFDQIGDSNFTDLLPIAGGILIGDATFDTPIFALLTNVPKH